MTCPHCGADASTGQKFCPKCSRLVDSPLLKIKQQIDAAREEIRRDLNAARTVRFSPPPPPPTHEQLPRPQYHVKVATPDIQIPVAVPIRAPSLADARAHTAAVGGAARDDPSLAEQASAEEAARRGHHPRAAHGRVASLRSVRDGAARRQGRGRDQRRGGRGRGAGTVQAAGVVFGPRAARHDRRAHVVLRRAAAHDAVSRAAAADHRVLAHPRRRHRVPVHDYGVRHVEPPPVRALLPAPAAVAGDALGTDRHDLRHCDLAVSRREGHEVVLLGPLASFVERDGARGVAHLGEGRAGVRVPALRVRVRSGARLRHVRLGHAADGVQRSGADVSGGIQSVDGDAGARERRRRCALRRRDGCDGDIGAERELDGRRAGRRFGQHRGRPDQTVAAGAGRVRLAERRLLRPPGMRAHAGDVHPQRRRTEQGRAARPELRAPAAAWLHIPAADVRDARGALGHRFGDQHARLFLSCAAVGRER